MDPYLEAKIVKIVPGSWYQGITYDQYVWVQLKNGNIIILFDDQYRGLVKPEMIGQTKKIMISGIENINKIGEQKYGILVPEESILTGDTGGYTFFGQIIAIDESSSQLIVDVGIGNIEVHSRRNELPNYHIGDFLSVYYLRGDIFKILD